MPDESLLDGLTAAQRAAVVSEARPLGILAGAGAGKTRVLTRRIAHRIASGTAESTHVLALTFTRRAAGELSHRLAALGVRDRVAAGTFHAIAYAQLRQVWADRGQRPPTLLEHKVRLIGPLLSGGAHLPALDLGQGRSVQPADVATEIEWAKARLLAPSQYAEAVHACGRRPSLPPATLAALYERYEQERSRRALVDFDDLVVLCGRALETDRHFAATQRWRFRHLFVDEFQDVNPAQYRLIRGWLGDRSDLCVVGDPNQAIYGWNGADPGYLTDFGRHFPGAETLRLEDNFRSSARVVAVANAVLGDRSALCLRPTRGDGAIPTVRSFATDRDEAEGVARALRRSRAPGRAWSHLAVLTRTHSQLVLLEEALRAASVPYRVRGSVAFLERPEIREALAELRRRPSHKPLSSVVAHLRELAGSPPTADRGEPGPGGGGTPSPVAEERRRHLEGLVRLATDQLAVDPTVSVDGFLAWLIATLRAEGAQVGSDAVELATLHAAKGLEWPVVFLAGLEQGLVPIGHAETPDARAEERRLFYVGVTRAEQELHCSWAERRTFGSRTLSRSPSPYLAPVEAAVQALAEGRPGADWRRHLDDSRAQVRGIDGSPSRRGHKAQRGEMGAGDPVVQALRSWRATTARATGLPAFVILHDSTLAAVAQARPIDRAGLLAVPGMGPVKAERYGDALLGVVSGRSAH